MASQASRHVEFFGVGVLSRFVKCFKDHYFQVEVKIGAKANRCLVVLIVVFIGASDHSSLCW